VAQQEGDGVRIGVVGAGTIGRVHVGAWRAILGADVVAVADPDEAAGRAVAEAVGARYYPDVEALVSHPGLDLVDVTVPTPAHRVTVEVALAAGFPVICEKPLARTVEDGTAMVEAARRAGRPLFVAHVVRFFPEYVALRDLVRDGVLGGIGTVRLFRGGPFPQGHRAWYQDARQSGGVILDLMLHDLDFLRWAFGEPANLYAVTRADPERVVTTYAQASFQMASGAIAYVEASWAHPTFHTWFEVAGDRGLAAHDSRESDPLRLERTRGEVPARPGVAVPARLGAENPYVAELRHFLQCLERGDTPRVTAEDALASLRLALAVEAAAEVREMRAWSSVGREGGYS
jgi:UDP-N-acetylglucosamine 3-dehydrogenase